MAPAEARPRIQARGLVGRELLVPITVTKVLGPQNSLEVHKTYKHCLGLAALEKKTGHSLSADQNEKVRRTPHSSLGNTRTNIDGQITDSGREFFEKQTGKNIPDKFSN